MTNFLGYFVEHGNTTPMSFPNIAATELLPLTDTVTPESTEQLADIVRSAAAEHTPVYPIGGGTCLNFGLPAKQAGLGLQLKGIDQVIDYPARDMTITVGAGIAMEVLQERLATDSQRLPVDAPHATQATLGGLIATNHSGPLRFGHGTLRDHVIGIKAVDGRGELFSGGGRVVKNVAGYDFCTLLTGSLGTLGVITQVTLKLKPRPAARALVCCQPPDLNQAEQLLTALMQSSTTPVAIELLTGACWNNAPGLGVSETGGGWLVIALEGTVVEVDWMTEQLEKEWRDQGVESIKSIRDVDADALYTQLIEFPADIESPLVLKITGLPSATTGILQTLHELDQNIATQAHAGNGIVIAKFSEFPPDGLSRVLTGRIKAVAAAAGGSATILSNPSGSEMTHHSVWGAADMPLEWMKRIKDAFDPHNILNPGRFVYVG